MIPPPKSASTLPDFHTLKSRSDFDRGKIKVQIKPSRYINTWRDTVIELVH